MTNLLVTDRVPGPSRALAIGVKQSGVPLAAFTAGLALPPLAAGAIRVGVTATSAQAVSMLAVVLGTDRSCMSSGAAKTWSSACVPTCRQLPAHRHW